jgi:hypothetical protein
MSNRQSRGHVKDAGDSVSNRVDRLWAFTTEVSKIIKRFS